MVRGFRTRRFLTISFLPALTLLYPCNPRNLWMVFPEHSFSNRDRCGKCGVRRQSRSGDGAVLRTLTLYQREREYNPKRCRAPNAVARFADSICFDVLVLGLSPRPYAAACSAG